MGLSFRLIIKILGVLLFAFSLCLLPALATALIMDETPWPWLWSIAAIALPGLLLWWYHRDASGGLRARDGFLVTALVWICLCAAATLVFWLVLGHRLSLVDTAFEAVSGLTTTGATVLTGLDQLPHSVLLYRQLLQWLGGMGVLVLATAVLPALEIGGMQLRREFSGISLGESMALPSRFKSQAQWLLVLYLIITLACMLAYHLAGMGPFDAVAHSFSTVAIGGFSTHDKSMGHFRSPAIEMVCVFFMLLATVNFALHFLALRQRSLLQYFRDAEFRFFVRWISLLVLLVTGLLVLRHGSLDEDAMRQGLFQTVSFATTTGFTTTTTADWPVALVLVLVLAACIGGCSGSMSGGLKGFRLLLFFGHASRELKRLVHPSAVFSIKLGSTSVSPKALESLWGFLTIWVMTFLGLFALTLICGMDPFTAFTAVAACLTNLGPGQGDVVSHYGDIGAAAKCVLAVAMLLGRLEIFTLLVLLTPNFWRR